VEEGVRCLVVNCGVILNCSAIETRKSGERIASV
jgi:hypothetical protein